MSQMIYYYLEKGDYLQLGDEYENELNSWRPIAVEWIGTRWGYDPETGELYNWVRVRRLVPKFFKKKEINVPIQEQYGEDFEI